MENISYSYLITGIVFFSCSLFIIGFWIKKHEIPLSNFFSKLCLILSSISISVVLLETLLLFFQRQMPPPKGFPPVPIILQKHKVNSHIMIKDSILYIAEPNQTFRSFGHEFTTNGFGFREKEFSLRKPNNVFRILVFGDSLTFGAGIDNDIRYTNILEEMLNEKVVNLKFEVINFGMGGYAIDQYHDLMKGILNIVECDLVMVGFFRNDLKQTSKAYLSDITQFENTNYRIFKFNNIEIFKNPERNLDTIPENIPQDFRNNPPWYKKSELYKLLAKRSNININGSLPTPSRWNYTLNEFLEMKELTKKRHLPSPVVILLHSGQLDPRKNNFKNPKGEMAQTIQLMKFVGKQLTLEGFNVVDTLPLFKKYSGMSMAVSEWESHPSYLGHYIYAQSILDFLISKYFDNKEIP